MEGVKINLEEFLFGHENTLAIKFSKKKSFLLLIVA